MKKVTKIFETASGELVYMASNGQIKCTNVSACIEAIKRDLNDPVVGKEANSLLFILKRL